MHRAHTEFNKKLAFRFLNTDELQRFISTVELRFNVRAFGFTLKSVRPEKFKTETHNFPVSKILDAIRNHPNDIRLYEICFSSVDLENRALADVVSVGIRVKCRSKFGDNDDQEREIELRGLNCYKGDFGYFTKAADEVFGLMPYFPPGVDSYDTTMSSFLDSGFLLPEARAFVSGSIRTRHYDLAIKAIAGLVESNLRDKIMSHDVSSAETAAGAQLAKMAYGKQDGVLRPPWDAATESLEGVHLMVRGFFLWIRNGFHHHARILENDKDGALELIQLCNAILKIIEKSTPRGQ